MNKHIEISYPKLSKRGELLIRDFLRLWPERHRRRVRDRIDGILCSISDRDWERFATYVRAVNRRKREATKPKGGTNAT